MNGKTIDSEDCALYERESRNKYDELLQGKNVEFEGVDDVTYELSHKEFKKQYRKMAIADSFVRSIVESDEKRCESEMKKLENKRGDFLKSERRRIRSKTTRSKENEEKEEFEIESSKIAKRMERLEKAKLKSKGIGLLCELAWFLNRAPACPGCNDELPCCDVKCNYSNTLLSLIERTDNKDIYSDDEDETELVTEESMDEEYWSSEYSSFDEEMVGRSQDEDDVNSSDEDYVESTKKTVARSKGTNGFRK
jgi:hypothetical protein